MSGTVPVVLLSTLLLTGCVAGLGRESIPEDPDLCPVHDVPLPPEWIAADTPPSEDIECPGDLRCLPEPFRANKARLKAYRGDIVRYNEARAECRNT